MADSQPVEEKIDEIVNTTSVVFESLSGYGSLILESLYIVIGAVLVIFVIHWLAAKLIYPRLKAKRLVRVFFGTLYALVIVIVSLLILEEIGVPTEGVAELALAGVLIGSVVVFFLVPFVPRLPLFIGHMVDINGTFGVVSAIDIFRITIKQFDGIITTLPTTMVLAAKIKNYSQLPHKRIEIKLSVNNDSELETTRQIVLQLLSVDERVLEEPSPPFTHVINATAAGVEMMAYCWVKTEDFLSTRTDLWLKLVQAFNDDERISMSLPQHEVFLHS
ncbi:MAG: mechanosensitive ion channel family protein [Desulfofustis sp.]|nr:mechanosensitive ion channel family protein [Desulfofustis sp.]